MKFPHYGDILRYLMLAVVLIDSFLLYQSFAALQSMTDFSRITLSEERLLSDLKDAECGQRGFLYTKGNEAYLPQYYTGMANTKTDMAVLRQNLLGRSEAHLLVEQVSNDVNDKLLELDTTVRAFRNGKPNEAREIVNTGHGIDLMDRIRESMAVLRTQERERMHYRGLVFPWGSIQ